MFLRFVFHKFLRMLAVLLGVMLLIFFLMRAVPGNPWRNYSTSPRALIGFSLDQTQEKNLNRRFGLDLPLWRQFTRFVVGDVDEEGRLFCGVVCGNFGPSLSQRGRSVQDVVFAPPENKGPWESRFGYSLRLVFLGALFAAGLGIPLGILAASRPNGALDQALSLGMAALVSIPNFVLGLLAIIVFASWLKWIKVLPDWENPAHWIIPTVVLAAMPMANIARVTRAALLNILHEDYIRTARAKGLRQSRVMLVHVLRNILVPLTTFLGPTLMEMFIGLFIVENLFSFPGLGRSYWQAVLQLDYPLIMGLTLMYAVGIVFINMLIDVLCELLDPRLMGRGEMRAT